MCFVMVFGAALRAVVRSIVVQTTLWLKPLFEICWFYVWTRAGSQPERVNRFFAHAIFSRVWFKERLVTHVFHLPIFVHRSHISSLTCNHESLISHHFLFLSTFFLCCILLTVMHNHSIHGQKGRSGRLDVQSPLTEREASHLCWRQCFIRGLVRVRVHGDTVRVKASVTISRFGCFISCIVFVPRKTRAN